MSGIKFYNVTENWKFLSKNWEILRGWVSRSSKFQASSIEKSNELSAPFQKELKCNSQQAAQASLFSLQK